MIRVNCFLFTHSSTTVDVYSAIYIAHFKLIRCDTGNARDTYDAETKLKFFNYVFIQRAECVLINGEEHLISLTDKTPGPGPENDSMRCAQERTSFV